MLKVGLYGFGGIAQAHKKAYEINAAAGVPVKLVAACDITEDRFKKDIEINIDVESTAEKAKINTYPSIDAMLAAEELDIIDICLPTYLHANAAISMLEKGYHVLSEKPMARTYADCMRMVEAAKKSKGKLMIAHCMRFRPEYLYLKELIEKNTYGKVETAHFNRLANPPIWAWNNWYMDAEKSGGCMMDMHIHDVDMVRFLFGDPSYVSAVSRDKQSKYDSNYTRFIYDDDKTVVAVGDWSLSKGFGFTQGYRVAFERATVVYDGITETVTLYEGDKAPVPAPITITDGKVNEIKYFVEMIINGTDNVKNTPESTAGTIALIEKMVESAAAKGVEVAVS